MSDLAIMFDEATEKANGNDVALFNELKQVHKTLTLTISLSMYDVLGLYGDWKKAQAA